MIYNFYIQKVFCDTKAAANELALRSGMSDKVSKSIFNYFFYKKYYDST